MIISKTPLRISFAGGGSDLPSYYSQEPGKVISTSINKYVYVIIKKRFDDMIYINYSKKEIVSDVDKIEHDLVRESMKRTGIKKGVEITTLSDIPSSGSGLGSSSAITVGLLNAMYNYKNIIKSQEDLAEEACQIEIDICKNPIGKQDQYGCAIGGLKKIKFNSNGIVKTEKISYEYLSDLDRNLYLCYTNITRSANAILSKQSKSSKKNKSQNHLIIKSVEEFKKILFSKPLDEVGIFLDKAWQLKKEMSEDITNQEIEKLYLEGKKAGALGGKILGAGGGGFILFYVPRNNQQVFEQEMIKHTFLNFNFEKHGSKIIFLEG